MTWIWKGPGNKSLFLRIRDSRLMRDSLRIRPQQLHKARPAR